MNEIQRATLRALCDTYVPAIARDEDPDGFWARRASDVGAPDGIAQVLTTLPPDQSGGLLQLLDALAAQGFADASQRSREQLLRNVALSSPAAAGGVQAFGALTMMFTYGGVDGSLRNPFWATFGYPGPQSGPTGAPKHIRPLEPEGDTTLRADVVVVGSGAGGGVVAGELATRGLEVVVLEAGGHFDEGDFVPLELWANANLYWRGNNVPTADGNISLQAGSALGGGTVINWTNSLRTKPWVREQWAREHGLEGVDGPEFDEHLDAVWARLGVNDRCSQLNGTQTRMQEGAEALGWSFKTVHRNADPARHDPDLAGYIGFGDPTGAKRSTEKTYLRDAFDAGARILVGAWVERVIVEDGRAAGVEATWTDRATGRSARVTVRAPHVVVAAGALESPALLLRSGIGGPAAGRNLRLHPCTATFGTYREDQRAWWGAPHAGLVDEFADADGEGYGFLIEATQYTTALAAAALPFTTAEEHKRLMHDFKYGATFIGLVRDRGAGRVELGPDGMAVPYYALEDEPADVAMTHLAVRKQLECHIAAGADEVRVLAAGMPTWRRGDDLDAFMARVQRVPLRGGGMKLFSAHQMGTCRMGADPATSVADPDGQLHGTPGVWIGDASAFPTASGTNPMISIMALARRTATRIAARATARTTAGAVA